MGDAGRLDARGRLWFYGRVVQRVVTPTTTLFSVPVEAVVEAAYPMWRAALVGVGKKGQQRAVVVVTHRQHAAQRMPPPSVQDVQRLPGCADITGVLVYNKPFPVDRRHNAKIEREMLAMWAEQKMQ
jgi:acyl-coenzyme A synthetase/AMP-(fatty) acid ligase